MVLCLNKRNVKKSKKALQLVHPSQNLAYHIAPKVYEVVMKLQEYWSACEDVHLGVLLADSFSNSRIIAFNLLKSWRLHLKFTANNTVHLHT